MDPPAMCALRLQRGTISGCNRWKLQSFHGGQPRVLPRYKTCSVLSLKAGSGALSVLHRSLSPSCSQMIFFMLQIHLLDLMMLSGVDNI